METFAGEQAQVDWAYFGHVMVGGPGGRYPATWYLRFKACLYSQKRRIGSAKAL